MVLHLKKVLTNVIVYRINELDYTIVNGNNKRLYNALFRILNSARDFPA